MKTSPQSKHMLQQAGLPAEGPGEVGVWTLEEIEKQKSDYEKLIEEHYAFDNIEPDEYLYSL